VSSRTFSREVARFPATDEGGREHTVIVRQHYRETVDLDGVRKETPTVKELLTDDGRDVNPVAKGEYEVVQTGARLRSDHPGAV
jgi:hypothetical protein